MSRQWYYAQNGQQFGPVSGEELRALLASGTVRGGDLVWSDSLPAWTPAAQVPALMPAPAPAPVYTPPAPAPAPAYTPPAPAPAPVYTPPAPAYAAPAPSFAQPAQRPTPQPAAEGAVSAEVVELLARTKPWVRFISVLGFIFMGLGLLMTLIGMITALAAAGARGLGPVVVQLLATLVMVALQLPALVLLSRYASRIGNLVQSGHPQDLEDALAAQKSFWKYLGILVIVGFVLGVLAVILAVIIGASAASGLFR